jgi:hypothetical protein
MGQVFGGFNDFMHQDATAGKAPWQVAYEGMENSINWGMNAFGEATKPIGGFFDWAANSEIPVLDQAATGVRGAYEGVAEPLFGFTSSAVGDISKGRMPEVFTDAYRTLFDRDNYTRELEQAKQQAVNDYVNYAMSRGGMDYQTALDTANRKYSNDAQLAEYKGQQAFGELPAWMQLGTMVLDPIGNKVGGAVFGKPIQAGVKGLGKLADVTGVSDRAGAIGERLKSPQQRQGAFDRPADMLGELIDYDRERTGRTPYEILNDIVNNPESAYRDVGLSQDVVDHARYVLQHTDDAEARTALRETPQTPEGQIGVNSREPEQPLFPDRPAAPEPEPAAARPVEPLTQTQAEKDFANIKSASVQEFFPQEKQPTLPDYMQNIKAPGKAGETAEYVNAIKQSYGLQVKSLKVTGRSGKPEIVATRPLEQFGAFGAFGKIMNRFGDLTLGPMSRLYLNTMGRAIRDPLSNVMKLVAEHIPMTGARQVNLRYDRVFGDYLPRLSTSVTRDVGEASHATAVGRTGEGAQESAMKTLAYTLLAPQNELPSMALRRLSGGKFQNMNDFAEKAELGIKSYVYKREALKVFDRLTDEYARNGQLPFELKAAAQQGSLTADMLSDWVKGKMPQGADLGAAIRGEYNPLNFSTEVLSFVDKSLGGSNSAFGNILSDALNTLEDRVKEYNARQEATIQKGLSRTRNPKSRNLQEKTARANNQPVRLENLTPDHPLWKELETDLQKGWDAHYLAHVAQEALDPKVQQAVKLAARESLAWAAKDKNLVALKRMIAREQAALEGSYTARYREAPTPTPLRLPSPGKGGSPYIPQRFVNSMRKTHPEYTAKDIAERWADRRKPKALPEATPLSVETAPARTVIIQPYGKTKETYTIDARQADLWDEVTGKQLPGDMVEKAKAAAPGAKTYEQGRARARGYEDAAIKRYILGTLTDKEKTGNQVLVRFENGKLGLTNERNVKPEEILGPPEKVAQAPALPPATENIFSGVTDARGIAAKLKELEKFKSDKSYEEGGEALTVAHQKQLAEALATGDRATFDAAVETISKDKRYREGIRNEGDKVWQDASKANSNRLKTRLEYYWNKWEEQKNGKTAADQTAENRGVVEGSVLSESGAEGTAVGGRHLETNRPDSAVSDGRNNAGQLSDYYDRIYGYKVPDNIWLPDTLRKLAAKFDRVTPEQRARYFQNFMDADDHIRKVTGNTFKLDPDTLHPVRVEDGLSLQELVVAGRQGKPPPVGTAVPTLPKGVSADDLAAVHKAISDYMGPDALRLFHQMEPAERDAAISDIARMLTMPDPTDVRVIRQRLDLERATAESHLEALKTDMQERYATHKQSLEQQADRAAEVAQQKAANQVQEKQLAQQVLATRARLMVEAHQQAFKRTSGIYFDYSNKNVLDQVLNPIIPFNFWARQNFMWTGKYFAAHPYQLAALVHFFQVNEKQNNDRGIQGLPAANMYLWTNPDGSHVLWNFASVVPFNPFGDNDSLMQVIGPDDAATSVANKTPLAVLFGADRVNSRGKVTGRDKGVLPTFLRPNPVIDIATKTGVVSEIYKALGWTSDNFGAPDAGDNWKQKQTANLIPGAPFYREVGARTGATAALRKAGVSIADLDPEGPLNELLFGRLAGKPLTRIEQELTAMTREGTINKDTGRLAIAALKEGNWTPAALAALDRVEGENASRRLASLIGFSSVVTNTPRQQVASQLYAGMGQAAGSPNAKGRYETGPDGKRTYIQGDESKFYEQHPEANVLFAGNKEPGAIRQAVQNDATRAARSRLEQQRHDKQISSKEYNRQMDILAAKDPSFFETNPIDHHRADYFETLEQYQKIGGAKYDALSKMVSDYMAKGDKKSAGVILGSKEYTQAKAARDQFLEDNPDWANEYKAASEAKYGPKPEKKAAPTTNRYYSPPSASSRPAAKKAVARGGSYRPPPRAAGPDPGPAKTTKKPAYNPAAARKVAAIFGSGPTRKLPMPAPRPRKPKTSTNSRIKQPIAYNDSVSYSNATGGPRKFYFAKTSPKKGTPPPKFYFPK